MNHYLDPNILAEFRNLINSSNIFFKLNEQRPRWNLICTLMDRLDSAVSYLNLHTNQPQTEEEFIFIMVFASIVKDGIYKFYENVYGKKPSTLEEKKWFSCASVYDRPFFNEKTCPTDDVFFEYLRSITFAHPFETSKGNRRNRLFMKDEEIHISPWVFCNSFLYNNEMVGVRVYTNDNVEQDILDLLIPFNNLKLYVKERYELIREFISWGENAIDIQNQKWKTKKVNRIGTTSDILLNIKEVLNERFMDEYLIDDAIDILNYSSNIDKNNIAVSNIKTLIDEKIVNICDSVDNLDYERLYEELDILYKKPKNLHQMANYQLEKVFTYLNGPRESIILGSNEQWGIIQGKSFFQQYAHKYVSIDFDNMSYLEIRILIRVSCILGWIEECGKK